MQFDPGMEYRPGWGDGGYFYRISLNDDKIANEIIKIYLIFQLHLDNNGNRY